MVVIEIQFVTGRYHASPWNAEPNEGKVEWPPSPWRIVRALISTYFERHRELDEETLHSLTAKLGGHLPSYFLPPAVHTHTRHYMPRTDKDATRKTFDTFLRLDAETPLTITWDKVDLDARERSMLGVLLRDMGYFGRAESLAQGRCVDTTTHAANCAPDTGEGDGEVEEVLALEPHEAFASVIGEAETTMRARWLAEERAKAIEKGKDPPESLSKSQEKKLQQLVPRTPFDAACATTDALQKAGIVRPLGTRWVRYRRPQLETIRVDRRASAPRSWSVALYSVDSNLLPVATDLLHHTDRLHKAIVSRAKSGLLAGVHSDGRRREGHEHAHILPLPDRHGRLERLAIWVPGEFADEGLAALEKIDALWAKREDFVNLRLIGVGTPEELQHAGDCFGVSRVWRSLTPFVPTRFPKRTRAGVAKLDSSYELNFAGQTRPLQRGSAAHDLVRLLTLRGFPRPVSIDLAEEANFGAVSVPWRSFVTKRDKGGDGKESREERFGGRRGPGAGVGFVVEFPEPVAGPVVAGYGAHFGLGLFTPA